MSTLTRALGLTKGAIYGNFTDKDALAVEAFRYSVRLVADGVREQLQLHERAVDKIRAFARTFLDLYDDIVRSGGCPILNTAADSDDAHPQLHEEVRRILTAWEGRLVTLVDTAKERGEIRPDADAALFATIFIPYPRHPPARMTKNLNSVTDRLLIDRWRRTKAEFNGRIAWN
jgi:AcrR family transcriptional regulator